MLNIMNACLCSKLPCQNEVCWPLSACTPASLCSSIQSSLKNNQPQHTSTTSVAMLMHAKTSNNAQQGSGRTSASSHRQLLALSGFSGTSNSRAQHNSATISCSERVHTIYTTTNSPYMHAHEYVHVGMHTMTCRDRCHWLSLPVTINGNDYWLSEQPGTTIGVPLVLWISQHRYARFLTAVLQPISMHNTSLCFAVICGVIDTKSHEVV